MTPRKFWRLLKAWATTPTSRVFDAPLRPVSVSEVKAMIAESEARTQAAIVDGIRRGKYFT